MSSTTPTTFDGETSHHTQLPEPFSLTLNSSNVCSRYLAKRQEITARVFLGQGPAARTGQIPISGDSPAKAPSQLAGHESGMSRNSSYSPARPQAKKKLKDCSLEPLTELDELEAAERNWCSKVFLTLLWIVGVVLVVSLVSVIVFVECFYKWSFPLRIDCNLDGKLDFNRCLQRGCRYVVTDENLPVCFFPEDHGYVRAGSEESTRDGFQLTLHRDSKKTIFANEFDHVRLQVVYETPNRVRFKFAPVNTSWYEAEAFPVSSDAQPFTPLYRVSYKNEKPFGIQIHRNDTGTVLFDSALPGMVLSEQFLQISSHLATANLFAFGRKTAQRGLQWESWTLFSRASEGNDTNDPGVHPFYMVVEDDGKAHGVLLLNGNGMDVLVQPEKIITFRTIGGVLDFYLLVGTSPEDVVQQYTQLVGRPFMPPQWALGTHTMVPSETESEAVPQLLDLLLSHGVPLTAIHLDRELVRGLAVERFATSLISSLHATDVKLMLTADPFVSVTELGKNLMILLESNEDAEPKFATNLAFIDFTNPNATGYWSKTCEELYGAMEYDGLVLESNEPTYPPHVQWVPCADDVWNKPPYTPGGFTELFYRSVCGDVQQFGGRHYDLHNAYGHTHAEATWKALRELAPTKRPVILSQSTFVGSGKYAGHAHRPSYRCDGGVIRTSIAKVLQLSLVGIPYSGVEMLHGFRGCSETLQARWLQTAALFPLSTFPLPREQRDLGTTTSDFVRSMAKTTKDVLTTRKALVPYLYTLFYEASTQGLPVARPLFYEFPRDPNTFGVNQQFMLGPAMLISSAADEEGNMEAYFPRGTWCDFATGKATEIKEGSHVKLPTFPNPQIHIRGGYVVPLRDTSQGQNFLQLYVAPDVKGAAKGRIFLDDGGSYRDDLKESSQEMSFTLSKERNVHELTITLASASRGDPRGVVVSGIRICGVTKPSRIETDDKTLTTFSVRYEENVLYLHSLGLQPGNHTVRMTYRQ